MRNVTFKNGERMFGEFLTARREDLKTSIVPEMRLSQWTPRTSRTSRTKVSSPCDLGLQGWSRGRGTHGYAGCVKFILPKVTQDKQASTSIDFSGNEGTLFNFRGTNFNLWPMAMHCNFLTEIRNRK